MSTIVSATLGSKGPGNRSNFQYGASKAKTLTRVVVGRNADILNYGNLQASDAPSGVRFNDGYGCRLRPLFGHATCEPNSPNSPRSGACDSNIGPSTCALGTDFTVSRDDENWRDLVIFNNAGTWRRCTAFGTDADLVEHGPCRNFN